MSWKKVNKDVRILGDIRFIDVHKVEFDEEVFKQMCEAFENGEKPELNWNDLVQKCFEEKVIAPYYNRLIEKYPNASQSNTFVDVAVFFEREKSDV